ncbi:MAG: hypothetical protein ACT443_11835 [Gemmatimonadota bacterium]
MRSRSTLPVVLLLLIFALPLAAQTVRARGYGEAELDAIVRAALNPRTLVIVRDTLIGAGDTISRDVLVLKSRFILEGTVRGAVTGVEANIYVRPRARITGQLTNIAGGYYPSELARVRVAEDRPLAPYRVRRDGGNYIIEGTIERPALRRLGGIQKPEYNRVDGLRVELGPEILLPPFAGVEPSISGSIGYATEREETLGRVELGLRRARSTLTFGWEDDLTRTNDDWIRSQLKNSLSVIWNGKDYRNYYETDRTFLEFRRVLERGRRTTQYWIRAQNELVHPLAAHNPFIIWDPDSIRPNPLVPVSRVTSAFIGAESEWEGQTAVWNLAASLEFAGKVMGADDAFNAYTAYALYATQAIADHTLEIETNFRGPLPGTETLPQQRWTFVGGSGTLYTFDIGQFRGDRLAFIETEYTIPFARRFALPMLGPPKLKLMHNIGMAWTHDERRAFEQNVGLRLQFALAYVRYIVNPENGDSKFSANVSFPSKAYPWERSNRSAR